MSDDKKRDTKQKDRKSVDGIIDRELKKSVVIKNVVARSPRDLETMTKKAQTKSKKKKVGKE
ncbi:MAG: hypothetical protein ACFFE6_10675 [Candidatus Thorarchaeota archaeon]